MTSDLRTTLRESLTSAMRMRDCDTTNVPGSTLAAIDNAEAVPLTKRGVRSGELPDIGVGSTEAERCDLTSRDVLDIVQHEIDELSRAASLLGYGQPESVARLRHQAAILTVVLAKAGH